jgi:alpha-L-fucosidase
MMNVALKGDGTLPESQAKLLKGFGDWLKINGEGIYGSRPCKIYGEGTLEILTRRTGENLKEFSSKDIRFTTKNGNLYAFVLATPTEDIHIISLKKNELLKSEIKNITLLGSDEKINWKITPQALEIKCPKNLNNQPAITFKIQLK